MSFLVKQEGAEPQHRLVKKRGNGTGPQHTLTQWGFFGKGARDWVIKVACLFVETPTMRRSPVLRTVTGSDEEAKLQVLDLD